MNWTPIPFNCDHEGKTLPQIVLSDPDWFFHAMGKGWFANKGKLTEEAEAIIRKARNIRIPPAENGEERIAEYAIDRNTGKFCDLEIRPRSDPPHQGSTQTVRKDVIDLRFPREKAYRDKSGCGLLLKALKSYIFKNSRIRFTRKVCEEFFDDDSNFVLDR